MIEAPRHDADGNFLGDVRPAVLERYKNRADYLNRIRVAAYHLVDQRFLLASDAAAIIQSAAQMAFQSLTIAGTRSARM